MKKQLLFLFAFLLMGSTNVFAQETKIAYANADSIFSSLPETAELQTRLEKYAKQWQDQIAQIEKDLEVKTKDFYFYRDSTNPADLIPKILEEKAKAAQDLQAKLQQERQNAQMDVAKKEQELIMPIEKKITDTIDAVAKEMGFSFVVPHNVMLFADPQYDITNAVIKKLGGTLGAGE